MDRPPVLTTGPTNALGIVLMAHALERSACEAHARPPGDEETWPKAVPPAEALRRPAAAAPWRSFGRSVSRLGRPATS